MNVQDKIKYMENIRGKNHDLKVFRKWLDEYLPDHKKLKKIQVAGTNGKGSTCQWMATFLRNINIRVGLFTSPHLVSHTERIKIDQENIELKEWERIYDAWFSFFEENKLTMFEIDLWMALVYFIENQVDVAILEVGLGGRLDATTSLDYIASLITNIGLDHQEFLGNTLESIAKEKAGILKKGTPAFCSETDEKCIQVIQEEATKKDVKVNFVHSFVYQVLDDGIRFEYNGKVYYANLARYQMHNLFLALETLSSLQYRLTNEVIQKSLCEFCWEGRFMIIRKEPLVILDGAHNVHGIDALVSSLSHFSGHIYFSVLKEKDAKMMIDRLNDLHCPITLVNFETERLYPLKELGYPVIEMKKLLEIIKTTKEDLLLCGSLYFVGELLANKALF